LRTVNDGGIDGTVPLKVVPFRDYSFKEKHYLSTKSNKITVDYFGDNTT